MNKLFEFNFKIFLNPNLNFNFKYLLASLHARWGQCDQNPGPDLVCWFVEDSSFLMIGYGCMGIFSSTFIAFSSCVPFPIRYIYYAFYLPKNLYTISKQTK